MQSFPIQQIVNYLNKNMETMPDSSIMEILASKIPKFKFKVISKSWTAELKLSSQHWKDKCNSFD